MDRESGASLLEHFSALEDPRQHAKVLYPLPEIVLLLLCATLAGADDFVEMPLWGTQNLVRWLFSDRRFRANPLSPTSP